MTWERVPSPTCGWCRVSQPCRSTRKSRASNLKTAIVAVEPTTPSNMEPGESFWMTRGPQWWYLGTPLQCKVLNRAKAAFNP